MADVPLQLARIRGATPDDVMAVLVDLAADVAADEAIVELGVFEGKTALYMAWGAQQGHGACLWG
ncbi:MAG TPA: hypothetical protein VF062_23505, partial [Candidatus Limnocylindrales bacterium]